MAEGGEPIVEVERRTAYEVQKEFAMLSGRREGAIWDALSTADANVLGDNIANLMPDVEGRRQNQVLRARSELFNAVWSQRKYTNGALHSAVIYVLVTKELEYELAKSSTQYTCHPVYRTRKCMKSDAFGSETTHGCCMVFVDEHGRVYQNWKNFLTNNILPMGLLLAPRNGIYNIDDDEEIELEHHLTPATTTSGRVVEATDTVVGGAGLAAAVPALASLAIPVAAPLLAVATVVGIGAAAYGTIRSATQLVDRAKHEQSNSLANRDARNSWLNVAGGAVALGAAGATKLFVRTWTSGQSLTTANQLIVSGLNISAVFISGSGAISGVYDIVLKLRDEEPVTGMDIVQLASSLMIFTHSVNNLRLANKIIETSKKGKTARRTLRRNLRRGMGSYSGEQQGQRESGDVVRVFNDIPVKETLLKLHQTYRNLVEPAAMSGIAIAFTENFDIVQFVQEYGGELISQVVNLDNFRNVFLTMGRYFSIRTVHFLTELAKTFLQVSSSVLCQRLHTFISAETVLYRILIFVIERYQNHAYEFLEKMTFEILHGVEEHFGALDPMGSGGEQVACKDCAGHYSLYKLT